MDLASPAVSGTSVYANGLKATCGSRIVATPGIWYGVHDMHLGSAQFTQLNIPYYALYVGKSKIMYRVSYAYV